MRAISLVNRIEFNFTGNVARHALALGDVDNDGCNELIIGNTSGTVVIFKGEEKFQEIANLTFISCIAVGDILNENKQFLVIVTADGWCRIYESYILEETVVCEEKLNEEGNKVEDLPSPTDVKKKTSTAKNYASNSLKCIHIQRIPANVMDIVLGDIDGDGQMEMVLGLTDRVVRSYKWMPKTNDSSFRISESLSDCADQIRGRFVAVNKWECANQIGSITLHHAWSGEPCLLIAQPGGTFMRIKCKNDLELSSEKSEQFHSSQSSSESTNANSAVDYQFLGITRMRNQNISTEILGDFNTLYDSAKLKNEDCNIPITIKNSKSRPYAVATLDGTIMFVQDEVILWAIAVDHQIFALTKLDVTQNGSDDIVACSWDGQTYILDQEKNSVRFQFDQSVQAFHSGYYHLGPDEPAVTCFVYVTFKNTVVLYYDIPLKELTCKKFEPDLTTLYAKLEESGTTRCIVDHNTNM